MAVKASKRFRVAAYQLSHFYIVERILKRIRFDLFDGHNPTHEVNVRGEPGSLNVQLPDCFIFRIFDLDVIQEPGAIFIARVGDLSSLAAEYDAAVLAFFNKAGGMMSERPGR